MKQIEHVYNTFLNTVGYAALPFLKSKTGQDPAFWEGRMGHYGSKTPDEKKLRIWFHAASVGEVTGALPLLDAVRRRFPLAAIYLTVGTPQGFHFAQTHFGNGIGVFPFPLDFQRILERAFRYLQPHLYVALESEFWPNLFRLLRERRIPALLLNGRLSPRSARRYRFLKPLFQPIFGQFRFLAMHSQEDRQNIVGLGAPSDRTLVLGSTKYDGMSTKVRPETTLQWRTLLDIPSFLPVMVGGSLRGSECTQLLEVFHTVRKAEPRLIGIFAPRHMKRLPEMVQWLRNRGGAFHLLSHLEEGKEKRQFPIILVDRIGVLFELYALGNLIFCGGTLEPVGGHNILEPAAWEKPVFYGPHIEKIRKEHEMLEAHKGAFLIRDATQLAEQWKDWICRLPQLDSHGKGAGKALEKLTGATGKQIGLILKTLGENGIFPE